MGQMTETIMGRKKNKKLGADATHHGEVLQNRAHRVHVGVRQELPDA